MPAAAVRVRVGVSRDEEYGFSLKLRPGGECDVEGGDDFPVVGSVLRMGTRLSDAERRFRALRELVGDGRPDAGGREQISCSDTEPSVSSNIVNSASVMSALSRLLTGGTIVFPECDDSASDTGRGDRLPESAPGRMVLWLAIVESLFRQSSFAAAALSRSCELPDFSVADDVPVSPPSEGCLECWVACAGGDG